MLVLRPIAWRGLHSSAPLFHLVGPPDHISHIRPVIYDDVPPPPPPSRLQHPYSLAEFDPEPPVGTGAFDLQWKLQRQQIDNMDQNFWHDVCNHSCFLPSIGTDIHLHQSNVRFEGGKDAVLASLPSTATTLDKENALSEFYKQWVMQEKDRTNGYTDEWRARNISCITMAARASFSKFIRTITLKS